MYTKNPSDPFSIILEKLLRKRKEGKLIGDSLCFVIVSLIVFAGKRISTVGDEVHVMVL